MTSIERIEKVLKREKADRPACSLRCTPEVWDDLMRHFGVATKADVLDKLDVDLRWVSVPFCGPSDRSAPTMGGAGTDLWGNVMEASKNEFNTYYEIVKHPLANCKTVDEIMDYAWPSLDWWDYSKIKDDIKANNKSGDRAILYTCGGGFEHAWYMRGMEQFLVDLYEDPAIVTAILSKIIEYAYKKAMRVLEAADGKINIVAAGGDIGGQDGLMLSPEIWRELIKPHSAGLIVPFKKMGFGTFYHSCGSVTEVIDDFIGMGLDMIDPIQVTARNMQPENLFNRFGDRISFHGAIDEQHLLPHASPREVYDETTRIISILGGNGGYVVSPSHQIQGDTSVANIVAIYKAVKDFRY